MKRLLVIGLVLVLVLPVGTAFAQDYVPSPGVLSPDQVDFGGAIITFVGGVDESHFGDDTAKAGRLQEAMELFNIGGFVFLYRPSVDISMARIMTGEATHDIIHRDWRDEYFSMAGFDMLVPLNDILPDEYFDYLFPTDQRCTPKSLPFGATSIPSAISMGAIGARPLWCTTRACWNGKASRISMICGRTQSGHGKMPKGSPLMLPEIPMVTARLINGVSHGAGLTTQSMNNAQFIKIEPDGRYRYGWADEEAIWVFDKIAEWYREGYIVPSSLDGDNRIQHGTVAMQFGSDHAENGGVANNGDIIVYAPIPTGPHADHYVYPEWAVKFASIPVTAVNPEGLIAVHDFLFRKDDLDFDSWLASTIVSRYPNRESADHLMYALQNWQGDVEWVNGLDSPEVSVGWSQDLAPLFRGDVVPRTHLEAKAPVAQAQIDALFNK